MKTTEYYNDRQAIDRALMRISRKGKTLPTNRGPHIRVEFSRNLTIAALIARIFAAIEATIGEEIPASLKRGNICVLAHNLRQVCRAIHPGVLIIDEVQRSLRPDGRPEPHLLNFLVQLSNTLPVRIVFVGPGGSPFQF